MTLAGHAPESTVAWPFAQRPEPAAANSARPGLGAQPAPIAGRGDPGDDRSPGLPRRAGRRRAGHRQPGGDDLRRARPRSGSPRASNIPAATSGPGSRPGQGPRGHRRRRQGRQVHGLRRRPEHPLGDRRRPRRRLGRQLARYPLPPGPRRRRQGRHAARSSRPASAAPTPTSCPTR